MGRFADAQVEALRRVDEIADFERLLEMPDHDILGWVIGAEPAPEAQRRRVLARILAFHGTPLTMPASPSPASPPSLKPRAR